MADESNTMHVAIRFFSDESKKVLCVPITDVSNLDIEKDYINEPFYIKKYEGSTDKFHFSPGQVLSSVGTLEQLLNRKTRFKFSKMRRSDAIQRLRLQHREIPEQINKNIKKKLKKLAKKTSGKQQLQKFLTKRMELKDSDEEINLKKNRRSFPIKKRQLFASDDENINVDNSDNQSKEKNNIANEEDLPSANTPAETLDELNTISPGSSVSHQSSLYLNRTGRSYSGSPPRNEPEIQNVETPRSRPNRRNEHDERNEHIVHYNKRPFSRSPPRNEPVIQNVGTPRSRPNRRNEHNDERSFSRSPPRNEPVIENVGTPRSRPNRRNEPNDERSFSRSPPRNEQIQNVGTPRLRPNRRRGFVYRLKTAGEQIESEDENQYDNHLSSEVREVNEEGRQLYEIEGDEIYIGCGKMIQLAFWEYIKHRSHWVFLRELLVIFWGKYHLVNRCFKKSKVTTELYQRSPRKCFTPKKYKNLRRLFKDYLDEIFHHSTKKKRILRYMNKHIGYKIRDIRKLDYEKVSI
ncbi:uncharacterized protein [Temnothorax longispinosus]|uniref:uncharacterized protein isoform X3 n=1 Tax=Temnothorax longispinosus TaxID=300112 RepID=UPI003A994401